VLVITPSATSRVIVALLYKCGVAVQHVPTLRPHAPLLFALVVLPNAQMVIVPQVHARQFPNAGVGTLPVHRVDYVASLKMTVLPLLFVHLVTCFVPMQ